MPIADICPQYAVSEYQAFVNDVNNAFQKVGIIESTIQGAIQRTHWNKQ